MKRTRAKPDQQLSLDLVSTRSGESKSRSSGGGVVLLKTFAEKKQNSTKVSALRKVLEHAKSLSW